MVSLRTYIFLAAAFCALAVSHCARADVVYSYSDYYSYSTGVGSFRLPTDVVEYTGWANVTAPDFVDGTEWFSTDSCFSGGLSDGSVYGSHCVGVELSVSGGTVAIDTYGCWTPPLSSCSTSSTDFTHLGEVFISGVPADTNVSYETYDPAHNETVTFTIEDASIPGVLLLPAPEPATLALMFPVALALLLGWVRCASSGRLRLFLSGQGAEAIDPGRRHAAEKRFDRFD